MTRLENAREVLVVSGARTGIGDYGGALKEMPATKLGAAAIKEAVARAKIEPARVGHVVMGSVIHGEAKDMYLSRVAAIEAGMPVGTPCLTVNRLCGSGLQAIVSASQHIMLGDCDVVVRVEVARERRQRAVGHADRDGRHVLERIRHREQQHVHGRGLD